VVNTWNPNSTNPVISQSLTCSPGEYYYVIVTQADNNEAISSPIWCEGANLPPTAAMTYPSNYSEFSEPANVTLTADASDPDGTIAKVEFFRGLVKLGEDLVSPFSFNWTDILDGMYTITAKATDNLGAQSTSAPLTVIVTPQGFFEASSAIVAGTDDAEESTTGVMYLTSTDLELVYDSYNSAGNQTVGVRFPNPGIPADASIYKSYLQFTTDEVTTGACSLTIQGEASVAPATFSTTALNISSRPKTATSVPWSPPAWTTAGIAGLDQRTPDLAGILQEITDLPGYISTSAICMILSGTGTRTAEAYEGSSSQAPKLAVIYSVPPIANFTGNPTTLNLGNSVQFTDQSTREPVSWNWSFPGGTPSSSIEQNPSVTYNSTGTYSVTLTVTNAAGSNSLTRTDYIQVNTPGYCSSQSTNFSFEYIQKFTLGTFVNSSGGSTYSNFTGMNIPLQSNKKYTVIITPKFSGTKKQEYFKIWIDYNNDLDFDDPGENVVTGTKNGELRTSFTTPSGMTGTKRMRVAMKRDAYSVPCETFTYGEVEDYSVNFGTKSSEAEITINKTPGEGNNPLKIFPNPASDKLFIENIHDNPCLFRVYTLHGTLILETKIESSFTTIDIGNFQPGLYLIRVSGTNSSFSRKLVVY
jgi:PKD repeat protein